MKKSAEKLENLALLEKRDDVKIRQDKIELEKLEARAALANPEYNPHAGIAPAYIY